jgi:hypothetical protein
VGLLAGVAGEPGKFAEPAFVVAEAVVRVAAGTAGVFPLGLGRQPIAVGLEVALGRILVELNRCAVVARSLLSRLRAVSGLD